MKAITWWEVHFKSDSIDDLIGHAVFNGAAGGQVLGDNAGVLFVQGDEKLKQIATLLKQYGVCDLKSTLVQEKNWVQQCEQLWNEVSIGNLKIIPIESSASVANDCDRKSDSCIYLIPGTGFGTGHHATTAKCIEYLQDPRLQQINPSNALDIGCGSGILAIAIHRLFPSAKVLALDNDPLALENAADNISINQATDWIKLLCGELSTVAGRFELIVANIYAEVLIQLEPRIIELIDRNGVLILSGISSAKLPLLLERYRNWEILSSSEDAGWCSLLLARSKE